MICVDNNAMLTAQNLQIWRNDARNVNMFIWMHHTNVYDDGAHFALRNMAAGAKRARHHTQSIKRYRKQGAQSACRLYHVARDAYK